MHLTDGKGNVVKNYSYDAFGNEGKAQVNDENPFRYGGEYLGMVGNILIAKQGSII